MKKEKKVGDLLLKLGKKIAIAESCTGGLISKRITDIPGSSRYFELGVVVYSNEAKRKILGVSSAMLKKHGAVSEEVVRAMAEEVRKLAGADYGLAVSGIAGPTGATRTKPKGLVFIAFSAGEGSTVLKKIFSGARTEVRTKSATTALDLAYKMIKRECFEVH
jgi:nicotinamide-nucleotide amidase